MYLSLLVHSKYLLMSVRSWSFSLSDTKLAWFYKKMNVLQGNCCILWIDIAWSLQKLGLLLEKKGCVFTKNGLLNWYSYMIFFLKIPLIFDIENWLWKYNFGAFWRTIIHCRIILKQFPLSMSILGQKSCILADPPTKIPKPNWN